MTRAIGLIFVLALTACTTMPAARYSDDPCRAGETTIACQDFRYSHGP